MGVFEVIARYHPICFNSLWDKGFLYFEQNYRRAPNGTDLYLESPQKSPQNLTYDVIRNILNR